MNTITRVLHVVTTMNQGGAETMLMNYYRHIDRSQLQFDFLLHRENIGAYEEEILSMGGKIHRLPALTLHTALSYSKWISDFLKKHPEYEIIHIHSAGVAYFVAKEASKLKRKCIIQHAHACARNVIDWSTPIRYLCKVATRKHLTHFFSCGKEAAAWLFGKKGAKKAIILPNAVDCEKFRYDEERHYALRKELGWEDKYVIGNVARFCYPKNHFQLLEIFKATLAIKPNAYLVLVGKKDGYYEELKQKVDLMGLSNHVEFTGARSDVHQLLQAFDVFVFPSLFEGLSVAMIEAQAAGLKIVASDNIAIESAICPELVKFLSLSLPSTKWAEEIIKPYDRKNRYLEILDANYDIQVNAITLQNFYLNSLQV